MPSTTKRKKNPVVQRDAKPFPFMAPDYPVKPWVNPATEARFMTVSFRQDDGTFAAFIAEDESVWAVGKTRREAENAVKALYAAAGGGKQRTANPEADDVEDDLRALDASMKGKFVDWDDVRHKYAR